MSQTLAATEIAKLVDSISTQIRQSIQSPSGQGYTNSNTLSEAIELQNAAKILRRHSSYRANPNLPQTANLVESGHKWTCPNCSTVNRLAEVPKSRVVDCSKCKEKFSTYAQPSDPSST